MNQDIPKILSIAGSDSIGGAGIQADIKTATALGVYSMTAITAVTAQNTLTVNSILPVGKSMLRDQLEAIAADILPDAVKIGMIPDGDSAEVIADFLEKYSPDNVVVDPIMISTSGNALSDEKVKDILCSRIFPIATVVTPNIPEALVLSEIKDIHRYPDIAQLLAEKYNIKAVLLKGGHDAKDNICIDSLYISDLNTTELFEHNFIESSNTHGTGCTLSSAIASFLAIGLNLSNAVYNAIQWQMEAIKSAVSLNLGKGNGSLNHLFAINRPNFNDTKSVKRISVPENT